MSAPSNQLSLPLPLFPPSSNFESKSRPVHASDCSLRPQKNIIWIKEKWWGSSVNEIAVSSVLEERETDKGNKRRRSNAIVRTGEEHCDESSYAGEKGEAKSMPFEPGDHLNSSKSFRNDSRRDAPPPFFSDSRSPRVHSTLTIDTSRQKKRSSRASRSHPWLSSRPAIPPPRPRSPSPPPPPLRSASLVLNTPILALQEQNQHDFSDYEPFLTNQAIEPMFSIPFYRNQIDFFTFVSPPSNWSNRVASKIFKRPSWPTLSEKVMNLGPNFILIRQRYPLKRSATELSGSQKDHPDWEGIRKVLEWIYGKKMRFEEYLWFVENVPLPLLALVKIHSSTQGYARGIWAVSCQFEDYLDKSLSNRLTGFEVRARDLLDWLRNGAAQGKKSERWRNWWRDEVQREREGKMAKGIYWLQGGDGMRTIRDLERWEDDMKSSKRWNYSQMPW